MRTVALFHCCQQLFTFALVVLWAAAASAQQVFEEARAVGKELMTAMLWLSSIIAACGFMGVGHAFSVGDIERGKALLRGTVIGTACIFSAAGIVQFIRSKFGQPGF